MMDTDLTDNSYCTHQGILAHRCWHVMVSWLRPLVQAEHKLSAEATEPANAMGVANATGGMEGGAPGLRLAVTPLGRRAVC